MFCFKSPVLLFQCKMRLAVDLFGLSFRGFYLFWTSLTTSRPHRKSDFGFNATRTSLTYPWPRSSLSTDQTNQYITTLICICLTIDVLANQSLLVNKSIYFQYILLIRVPIRHILLSLFFLLVNSIPPIHAISWEEGDNYVHAKILKRYF